MTTWLIRCSVCGATFQQASGLNVPVAFAPAYLLTLPQHVMTGTLIPCPGADVPGIAYGTRA
jgi:hypothetical protein